MSTNSRNESFIDYQKLKPYFSIQLHLTSIDDKLNYDNQYLPFKNCKESDFEEQAFELDSNFKTKLASFFCPDWHGMDNTHSDTIFVDNKYTNRTNQRSFSVEVVACTGNSSNCKSHDEIQKFLKSFYFTFYTVQERVEFKKDNLMQNPMSTKSYFHSQFMLDLAKYRDNNNFIRINDVITNDNRYSFNLEENFQYRYIDLLINQAWEGPSDTWSVNASWDHGQTY